MEDTSKELERIQKELLKEDTVSLDELLADEELNALLSEPEEQIPEKAEQLVYHNFANGYGSCGEKAEEDARMGRKKKKDDRVILGLMITASALCLGIIGVLAYWLTVFL